jgi:1-deoxy-D-xylulose-5-phosphate reductoisomerase
MKHIAILGSTGSIGRSALEVIRNFPEKFCVSALTTNSNIDILLAQIEEFHPEVVCVRDLNAALRLKPKLHSTKMRLLAGGDGLEAIVEDRRIDQVLLAISGSDALSPLLRAIDAQKDIALANKEALVMAGSIIIPRAKKRQVKILPIDSEQSAIWQCLEHQGKDKLKNIYLTASGGPFRLRNKKSFGDILPRQVLKHPCWNMGKKVTVDSATLMNKGLEILETMFLFAVGIDKIKIIIHPEAIIHSLVEFIDGVVLAQLSITDMRIPIQYAITYPERLPNDLRRLDFYQLKALHFQKPDLKKFPCLGLAYEAAKEAGTMPAVLNAANEVCVEEFLKRKIRFLDIPRVIEKVLSRHKSIAQPDLNDILEADSWARAESYRIITC